MLCFPPAKINIGLYVKARRPDGFHEIETLFCPVALCDILEVVVAKTFAFRLSGLPVDGSPDDNLCVKACRLLQADFDLPPVAVYLHKVIPTGAGLGGGSSDATAMLKLLNALFSLRLSTEQFRRYAVRIKKRLFPYRTRKSEMPAGTSEVPRRNVKTDRPLRGQRQARSAFPVRGFMSCGQRARAGVSFAIDMDGLRLTGNAPPQAIVYCLLFIGRAGSANSCSPIRAVAPAAAAGCGALFRPNSGDG